MKNPVEALITEYGTNPKTVFVFPSDVAATLWREEALDILGVGTVESRRFIAWDRFKAEAIRSAVGDKRPVTTPIRALYSRNLAKRNAENAMPGGTDGKDRLRPLLTSLIPPDFADSGDSFAPWIARLLPQLSLWEDKRSKARDMPLFGVPSSDDEDADLAFLKADYAAFLERHGLFEPSWEKPPLRETGFFYIIIFYEAIEDWNEFAPALKGAPFIKVVSSFESAASRSVLSSKLETHETTRDEIRHCALSVEALLMKGVRPDRVAVSVPDLETVAPYLTREFELRGIPYEYRAGTPLGGRSAGRIFRLLDACASENFSFASMKALLLDRIVPWGHPELAERLVTFGIDNRCVTSWTDDGKRIDPWLEAFRDPVRFTGPDEGLRDWYRELKKAITSLAAAGTFSEIRNRWFAFRGRFFDMTRLDAADDAVLARCVEELNALASLEAEFADVLDGGAWKFFLETLDRTTYVPQRASAGVNLFPWRVAAGTPFPWHFALDVSQDRAGVLYRQLAFLREDKRDALRSLEDDATSAFLAIYASCPRDGGLEGATGGMRFSAAFRSFKGYSTPHNALESVSAPPAPLSDPYRDELAFAAGAGTPDRLYPLQKTGWESAARRARNPGERRFNALRNAYGSHEGAASAEENAVKASAGTRQSEAAASVARRVTLRQYDEGAIRVTQTDLATHSVCPTRWFLGKVLEIKPPESDAELMDDRRLGIVYHEVFRRVYARIRDTDGAFRSSRLDAYAEWAAEAAETAARDSDEFKGPLAAPVLSTLVARIAAGVQAMLACDAEFLDGFIPEFLEDDISFAKEGLRYYGRIDRISRRAADGKLVLIDWKTGKAPSLEAYRTDSEARPGAIADFQMPMYVFLAENSPTSPYRGEKIACAWFGSVKEEKFMTVVDDGEAIELGKRRKPFSRDDFEPAIEAFSAQAAGFAASVKALDFRRPQALSRSECAKCDYVRICRWNYTVAPS